MTRKKRGLFRPGGAAVRDSLYAMLLCTLLAGCAGGAPQLGETRRRIADLNERALTSIEKNRPDDGRRVLDEALGLAAALDDDERQALTLLNLARLERRLGRLSEAEQLLKQGRYHGAATPYAADLAQETALVLLAGGNAAEARLWAETALREERGDMTARRLNLLARVALQQGDRAAGLACAEQALEKAGSREPLAEERANSLRLIGRLRGEEHRFDEAEKLLMEALALDRRLERPAKIAADLEALAELMERKGDTARGNDYRQRAARVRERLPAPGAGP